MSVPTVILCVGDEPIGLPARCLLLSIAGYDVLSAVDFDAAQGILRLRRVDLIITGHFLPGPNGAQVACQVKELNSGVPVVLLAESPASLRGAEYADLLLTKGIHPLEFLAKIAQLLSLRNGGQSKFTAS